MKQIKIIFKGSVKRLCMQKGAKWTKIAKAIETVYYGKPPYRFYAKRLQKRQDAIMKKEVAAEVREAKKVLRSFK